MAPNTGRQFKLVFMEAQNQLRSIFGMEITELPHKDKITISQKRGPYSLFILFLLCLHLMYLKL